MADVVAPAPAAAPAQAPARMRVSDMANAMARQLTSAPAGDPVRSQGAPGIMHQGQVSVVDDGALGQHNGPPAWMRPDATLPGKTENRQVLEQPGPDDPLGEGDPLEGDPGENELETQQSQELDYAQEYQKLKELVDSDDLPEEWLERKWVTKKINGKPTRMTVAESLEGHMTAREFSHRNGQLVQQQRLAQNIQQGARKFLSELEQPQTLIQAFRNMGKLGRAPDPHDINTGTGLMGAVAILADQMYQELSLKQSNPQAYALAMQKREAEERAWATQTELQRMRAQFAQQQAQQPQQADEQTQVYMNQLRQMTAIAFRRVGLPAQPSPTVERMFNAHYENLLSAHEGELTTEFIARVAKATKDEYDEAVRAAPPAPRAPGQPPAAQGIARGGPPPAARPGATQVRGPNGQVRMRVSDMNKSLRGY